MGLFSRVCPRVGAILKLGTRQEGGKITPQTKTQYSDIENQYLHDIAHNIA